MGLHDHDVRERPFTPPKEHSPLTIIAILLVAAFLLFKGHGWWLEKQRATSASSKKTTSSSKPQQPSQLPPQVPRPVPSPLARAEPTPPSRVQEEERSSTGGTIYLCKAYDGGTFWAQAHCNQHRALIDSIVNVPAGMPFEQQVRVAQQHRETLSRTVYAAPAQTESAVPSNKAACEALDERVRQLDAMARQPQSAATQDWIRAERKAARDRQFTLRC